jgi:hypothetical protein
MQGFPVGSFLFWKIERETAKAAFASAVSRGARAGPRDAIVNTERSLTPRHADVRAGE